MAYIDGNPQSKKQLKEWVDSGKTVTAFQPGLGPDLSNYTGTVSVEGPHYPKPHKWYASVTLENGRVTKVK